MSGSPSSNSDGPPPKRKRTVSSATSDRNYNGSQHGEGLAGGPGQVQLPPKRSSFSLFIPGFSALIKLFSWLQVAHELVQIVRRQV